MGAGRAKRMSEDSRPDEAKAGVDVDSGLAPRAGGGQLAGASAAAAAASGGGKGEG